MTWLQDEEREIELEIIKGRKRRVNKRVERYKLIKFLLLIIFSSAIFGFDFLKIERPMTLNVIQYVEMSDDDSI